MNFEYTARNTLNKVIEGQITAGDREDALQQLQRDGFQVLKISQEDDSGLFPRRVSKQDIIYAASQLGIMVETGITLSSAIDGICEQEENPTLRNILRDIKEQVEAGEDFSSALARHPKQFDKTFVALIRASEQTGTMGEMLERISHYMRAQLESRAKVRGAMTYPAVMMVIALGVTTFLLTYILPQFEPLFARKAQTLPSITRWMMVASNLMLGYWWAWLLGIVALVVGFLYARRTEKGREIIDWSKIHAPLFGVMYRKVILSRTINTLGLMVQSGVSMLDAVQMCVEVSANVYYEKAWRHVLAEITNGSTITDALRGNRLFPGTLLQMIDSGEETGQLDFVLKRVSGYYDKEVDNSLKTLTSLIEPLMITVMGVVVGAIAMGLLLPIFSLSRGH